MPTADLSAPPENTPHVQINLLNLINTVSELPKKDERSDVVGARFITPAGLGGANAAEFANSFTVPKSALESFLY